MYNFYNFYSLKTPENQTFPGAFRAYEMKTAKKKKKKWLTNLLNASVALI